MAVARRAGLHVEGINLPGHFILRCNGIFFDPFTDSLILSGQKHVTQIDRKTLTVTSDLDLSSLPALNTGGAADFLDQGASDGLGHLFVAANNGNLVFVDMSQSRMVSHPANVVRSARVDVNIDDVAPLSWLGSPKGPKSPKIPKSPKSPVSIP